MTLKLDTNARLFIDDGQNVPATTSISFSSATAVDNFFGPNTREAVLASQYFTGPNAANARMMFTRYGLGQRPHLIGANLNSLPLSSLQSIHGPISLTFDGFSYSGNVDLSGATSFNDAAINVAQALHHLPIAATANGSISACSASFTGSSSLATISVQSVQSGALQIGGVIHGAGINDTNSYSQIIRESNGVYYTFFIAGFTPVEPMTETYGVLHVNSVTSGVIGLGDRVEGPGIAPLTGIISDLGNGDYLVNNAQTISSEDIRITAPTLAVKAWHVSGQTANRDYLSIQPDGAFGFDEIPSSLSFASGSAADLLGLSQAFGAIDSSPGGQHPTVGQWMNSLLSQHAGWSSFQSIDDRANVPFSQWASTHPSHPFLSGYHLTTTPAGEL